MKVDLLIKNVEVIDGTGNLPLFGTIALKDGKICKDGDSWESYRVVDGSGLTLAPGFIDVHSHGDFVAGHDYGRLCKISQGITTEIAGQCGSSCFPVTPESRNLLLANANIVGKQIEENIDRFTNLAGYREYLDECSLSSNIMMFMGHSALRLAVVGTSDAKPNPEQLAKMCGLLEDAMKQGCLGLSTGLFYPPSAYADVDEVSALCEVVARYNGIHTTHIRNEGSGVLKSLEEVLEVSRRTGVRLNVSHHKVCGRQNWGMSKETLALLDQAREEGMTVTMDVYPYLASMTKLAACIPTEYFNKGVAWLQKELVKPELRAEIKAKMEQYEDGRYRQCGGFSGVMIGVCPSRPEAEGKFISDFAVEVGEDPFEVFFDMLVADGGKCNAIYFTMCEEDLCRIVSDPHTMIGTDGLVASLEGKTHPRGWASFPRAIRLFVREKNLFSLETMIYKITGLAAETYGLKKKGRIAAGYDADLVLFNREEIGDAADFVNSNRLCTGIKAVIVGGKIAYQDGKLTEEIPGRWIGAGGRR